MKKPTMKNAFQVWAICYREPNGAKFVNKKFTVDVDGESVWVENRFSTKGLAEKMLVKAEQERDAVVKIKQDRGRTITDYDKREFLIVTRWELPQTWQEIE